MEKEYKKIVRNLKKAGGPHEDQIDAVICKPPEWSNIGFAVLVFYEEDRKRRHHKMQRVAGLVFDGSEIERCVIIARDLAGNDYPYTTFGIFVRGR